MSPLFVSSHQSPLIEVSRCRLDDMTSVMTRSAIENEAVTGSKERMNFFIMMRGVYKISTGCGKGKEIVFEVVVKKREIVRMTTILAALGTGILVGVIFSALKLPLPAPQVWAGIMGIVGIFLGGELWRVVTEKFFS